MALACARTNVPAATAHLGDLYDALPGRLRGRIDVLAANAPYVPTDRIADMPPEARDHEPRAALDGGADGVDLHRRIAAGAPDWLAPGGVLLVETSPGQACAHDRGDGGRGTRRRRRGRSGDRRLRGRRHAHSNSGGAGVTMPTAASASSICSREMPSR